jgi:hypothetical protein
VTDPLCVRRMEEVKRGRATRRGNVSAVGVESERGEERSHNSRDEDVNNEQDGQPSHKYIANVVELNERADVKEENADANDAA